MENKKTKKSKIDKTEKKLEHVDLDTPMANNGPNISVDKDEVKEAKKFRREIILSLFTAIMAGVFSTIGFYFNSQIKAKNDMAQSQFDFKVSSYNSFLSSVSKNESPIIAEILSLGGMSKHVATDSEIQALEDGFNNLSMLNAEYKLSWQLDNDFNLLRLHGSERIKRYCDDIITVLNLREHNVDWTNYPRELQEFRTKWLRTKDGTAHGFTAKVSYEERIMFILASAQYKNLLLELRKEIGDN